MLKKLVLLSLLFSTNLYAQPTRIRYAPLASDPTTPSDGIFLSNVTASTDHNGFGPTELDKSLGDVAANDGTTITMAGLHYSKGLGVHAPSLLEYALNDRCTRFKASIGIDDEVGSNGSVDFQIWVNGRSTATGGIKKYDSGTLTGSSGTAQVDIDLTGFFELYLVVTDSGDGNAFDHADWAFARAVCTVPSGGTDINPGTAIQPLLTAGTTGQRFTLKKGVHRLTSTLTFKTNQILEGEFGTILSGGVILTGFTNSGCTGCWFILGASNGSTNIDTAQDTCWREGDINTGPLYLCKEDHDVFFDNQPYLAVRAQSDGIGTTGRFYLNHATGGVYIYEDPSAARIEMEGGLDRPFTDATFINGVVIQYLTIEKFTDYNAPAYPNWTLQHIDVRYGHGTGIYTEDNTLTQYSYVHHMGYQGFGGCCTAAVIDHVENSYNNFAKYNPYQGGGGSKWVNVTGLTVQNSYSHHNFGPGFWTDINNINVFYRFNRIEFNDRAGIFHEIGYDATINDNQIRENGKWEAAQNASYGACIQIMSSPNVTIYNNVCNDNGSGIIGHQDGRTSGSLGPHITGNFKAYDNVICQLTGYTAGVDGGVTFNTTNLDYHHNTYKTSSISNNAFSWNNGTTDFTGWRAAGQDATGTMTTPVSSCP